MIFGRFMMMSVVMASLLPMASWAEDATVYQCKDKNGTVIFSGTPCGADAKERVISAPNAGTGADTEGIKELANQYDVRRAQEAKNAAEVAAAAARAKAESGHPPSAEEPDIIGYPAPSYAPGYYSGYSSGGSGVSWWLNGSGDGWSVGVGSPPPHFGHPHHHRRPPMPPPVPYTYKDPGISGQFPGGAPGSTGSNFQPVRP
jgi:hypothetical protein